MPATAEKPPRVGCVSVFFFLAVALCLPWAMCGCAVGQAADGSYVVGVAAGDAAAQKIHAAAEKATELLPSPWKEVAGLAVTSVLGVWGVKKAGDARAAKAAHEGETKGWEDAVGKPAQATAAAATTSISAVPSPVAATPSP